MSTTEDIMKMVKWKQTVITF